MIQLIINILNGIITVLFSLFIINILRFGLILYDDKIQADE